MSPLWSTMDKLIWVDPTRWRPPYSQDSSGATLKLTGRLSRSVAAGGTHQLGISVGMFVLSKMHLIGKKADAAILAKQEEEGLAFARREAAEQASQGGQGASTRKKVHKSRIVKRGVASDEDWGGGESVEERMRIGGGDVLMVPAKIEFQFGGDGKNKNITMGVASHSVVMNRNTRRGGDEISCFAPSRC